MFTFCLIQTAGISERHSKVTLDRVGTAICFTGISSVVTSSSGKDENLNEKRKEKLLSYCVYTPLCPYVRCDGRLVGRSVCRSVGLSQLNILNFLLFPDPTAPVQML